MTEQVLPGSLVERLGDADRDVRLAAVEELGVLASGDDLGLATAARAELARLLDDDSRRVAAAAGRALQPALAARPVAPMAPDGRFGYVTDGDDGTITILRVS